MEHGADRVEAQGTRHKARGTSGNSFTLGTPGTLGAGGRIKLSLYLKKQLAAYLCPICVNL